jgi:hypothetical protein
MPPDTVRVVIVVAVLKVNVPPETAKLAPKVEVPLTVSGPLVNEIGAPELRLVMD